MTERDRMHEDDVELVRQAAAGDRAAFGRLVDRHRSAVWAMAYHTLASAEDAHDVAQEAFVQAYLHLNQLREAERFAPWLRRVTLNACAALGRKRQAWAAAETSAVAEAQAASASNPADRLAVREALHRLSEKTRLALTLCCLDGYSHAEVAAFLGVSVGTVRSRLRQARRCMREEMIAMVSDDVNAKKPDQTFTRKVVEEALRRADEAARGQHRAEALRLYDEALAAVDRTLPVDLQRLRLEALRGKCRVADRVYGRGAVVGFAQEAIDLARELGDRRAEAQMLIELGVLKHGEERHAAYRRALELFREAGDARGQAECLLWFGSDRLHELEPEAARPYFEQAAPLFQRGGALDYWATCEATFALMDEVGPERLKTAVYWFAGGMVLVRESGRSRFTAGPGYAQTSWRDGEVWPEVITNGPLAHAALHEAFYDENVPVGGHWDVHMWSGLDEPLMARISVLSDTEEVTVPAGTFQGCRMLEQVTNPPADLPPDTPAGKRRTAAGCSGLRRSWYAPGVGVVQVCLRADSGLEGTIQLHDHSVEPGSGRSYFPLVVGNRWDYGTPSAGTAFEAKDTWRVVAAERETFYLAHHGYVLRAG